jgi:hypothetical protein
MVVVFNLNLYESFCPPITNSLFIRHHFDKEFFELSFLLPNGFLGPISALFQTFSKVGQASHLQAPFFVLFDAKFYVNVN